MRLVSIVLPTLKEDGIGASLDALAAYLASRREDSFELVVVDDSPEPYKQAIRDYIAKNEARLAPRVVVRLVAGPRKGKGSAIREGVLASRGDVVFTMDADLPVPLENVGRFLQLLDEGADVVVGERPFDRNISQPLRFIASRALFALQRALVFQSRAFDDTQCGFKAFRGELARRLASRQVVEGGMVDIEYLYAAGKANARFARAAVTSVPETRATKINVRRAIVRDPIDLVRIKWAGITGRYRD